MASVRRKTKCYSTGSRMIQEISLAEMASLSDPLTGRDYNASEDLINQNRLRILAIYIPY